MRALSLFSDCLVGKVTFFGRRWGDWICVRGVDVEIAISNIDFLLRC